MPLLLAMVTQSFLQQSLSDVHDCPSARQAGAVLPQLVPSHVAVPAAGDGHGRHDVPHELMLLFDTH